MLKLYDYLEAMMEEQNHRQRFFESKLNYFASDIMEMLRISDPVELNVSLNRAFEACSSLHIPFDQNFKRIYRFNGKDMFTDWKISSLACYLIIINSSPTNSQVAQAQIFFL